MNQAYNVRPIPSAHKPRRSYRTLISAMLIVLVVAALYVVYALTRPLPGPKTVIIPPVIPAQVKVNIPWPSSGQAAFGAMGYGLLASHVADTPVPTASTAKVITALAVLEKHPLKPGETGPAITMTAADVNLYNQYVAEGGSVVPVYEGETITEYQALQAMMLPSANNIADTMAIWAFGSLQAYSAYANSYIKSLGMAATTIGSDASGFSPSTVSTASDLVRLGNKALQNPVLADIVGQSEAVFPGYGTMDNVNTLLGQYGIRGIKTGNTDEAGGCYLAAADVDVGGQKITVITAVMAASSRLTAMRDSIPMIQSAVSQFQNVRVVKAGDSVGTITTAWGSRTNILAQHSLSLLTWSGTALSPAIDNKHIPLPSPAGTNAGTLQLTAAGKSYSDELVTDNNLTQPTAKWRLTHPL